MKILANQAVHEHASFFLYKVIYTFIDKGYDDRLQRTGSLGL